ncbi:MAG: hypothetical protein V9F04_01175 [Dermatophilaceae bacterium]
MAKNYKLGLWWSQSLLYNKSRDDLVGLNINNETMVKTAMAELDRAIAAVRDERSGWTRSITAPCRRGCTSAGSR